MSNKKITDLTELTTPTTDDVFPVVDIATNTTRKVQLGNLPTTSVVSSAIASKQDTLVSGTNIKTLNNTSLLGSGNINVVASPSGVAGAIQFSNGSAFASDAANLFWDDTNNRLGIGTATPTSPVTVSFNDPTGSTVAANYANTSTNSSGAYNGIQISAQNGAVIGDLTVVPTGGSVLSGGGLVFRTQTNHAISFNTNDIARVRLTNAGLFGINTEAPTAQLQVKGSGSTSATTSLLVQNSSGSELAKVRDDGSVFYTSGYFNIQTSGVAAPSGGQQLNFNISGSGPGMTITNQNGTTYRIGQYIAANVFSIADVNASTPAFNINTSNNVLINTTTNVASSKLTIESTTQGFLPPRMTTTQKNAIATPASGLVVYDSTTNKLCCYNGSTWNDLF